MQGMHADGNKSTGFKSMVVAQFTGVSLQKDDNAFIKWDGSAYIARSHTDGDSIYKHHIEISMLNAPMMQLYRQYLFSLLVC